MDTNDTVPEASVHLAGPENSVLHFSGSPQAVTGIIPVVNDSSEKQKIRNIAINSEELRGPGGIPLKEILFRGRLKGGQRANLRARLPLDPLTPPGRYDFKVTVGSRTLPAVAYIPEVFDLRADPRVIVIIASGKNSSYTRTVICENRGNVVLLSGSRCEVPIFEDQPLLSAILDGLNKGDKESTESMVKSALVELAGLKVGTLVIKRKAITLSPGQKVAVEIHFELPTGLKPQHHYSASVKLYNRNLTVEIYTTAKPQGASSESK